MIQAHICFTAPYCSVSVCGRSDDKPSLFPTLVICAFSIALGQPGRRIINYMDHSLFFGFIKCVVSLFSILLISLCSYIYSFFFKLGHGLAVWLHSPSWRRNSLGNQRWLSPSSTSWGWELQVFIILDMYLLRMYSLGLEILTHSSLYYYFPPGLGIECKASCTVGECSPGKHTAALSSF